MRVLIKIFFILITLTAYSWAQEMSRYELLDKANELITTEDWEEGLDYYWQALDKGLRPSSQMSDNVFPFGLGVGSYYLDESTSGPLTHVFTIMERIHYNQYEEFLAEHARRFPDMAWIQYAYAFRLRQSEQYDLARDFAKKAVELKPGEYFFQREYLELLIRTGDKAEITKTIDRMLNIHIPLSNYRFNFFQGPRLSYLILVTEETDRTEEFFLRTIEKFPQRMAPLINYAFWLEYKGRTKEAEEYYKRSILSGDQIGDVSLSDIIKDILQDRHVGYKAALRYMNIAVKTMSSIEKTIQGHKEELFSAAFEDQAGLISMNDILRPLSEAEFDQLYQYFKSLDKEKVKNKKEAFFAFKVFLDRDQNYSKLVEILTDGVTEFPEDGTIYSFLIDVMAQQERKEGTYPSERFKKLYKEHLLRFPDSDLREHYSGNPFKGQEEEIYIKSIEIYPDNPYGYSRLALYLKQNRGEAGEIKKYYDLYAEKAFDWIEGHEDKCMEYRNLARFFDDFEMPANSAMTYERLYQLECGIDDERYKEGQIVNLLKMGTRDKAIAESQYLLENYKHYFYEPVISEISEALEKVATDIVESPGVDGGAALLKRLVDSYPDVGFFSYLYGGYLLQSGQVDKADQYILKSIQLTPNINQKLKDHSNDNLSDLEKRFLAIKYAL